MKDQRAWAAVNPKTKEIFCDTCGLVIMKTRQSIRDFISLNHDSKLIPEKIIIRKA